MKCKTCGKNFKLKAENKYYVTVPYYASKVSSVNDEIGEAFNCPKCGCQNVVNTVCLPIPTEKKEEG